MICLNLYIFSIVITARTNWRPLPTRLQMTAMYEQRKQTRPNVTHLPVTRSPTAMYEQRKQTRLPVTHLDLHV